MTPGARLSAAIEILSEIFARAAAADRTLAAWARSHRFAGAKDRAAIAERVYLVLRRRNECAWRMGTDESTRSLVLGSLSVADGLDVEAIDALCLDGAHAPGRLTPVERANLVRQAVAPSEPSVRFNYPKWLHEDLTAAFGGQLETEVAALNERAPLDLRVNALKSARDAVERELRDEGIEAKRCRFAPLGLRIAAGADVRIAGLELYRSGAIEIQDEASQLAVLIADARPGQTAIDLAAGAGGKSLALAAAMRNRGRVIGCDVDARRLAALSERAGRADATIVESGGDPYALKTGPADLVFVDAPCSGSGTWRRNPEAKWTLTAEKLDAYRAAQAQLLDRAAELCAPNGRIVFATCSVLGSEGAEQIGSFLARHAGWKVRPVIDIWRALALGGPPSGIAEFAMLSPARDRTDGFFVAVLGRA